MILETTLIVNKLNQINKNLERYQEEGDIERYEGEAGQAIGLIIFLLLTLGMWIWGLVVTIQFWKGHPDWARVVNIVFLVLGGPLVTVIVSYAARDTRGKK